MIDDSEIADNLIPGGLKKSKSYHSHLGGLTFREIKKRIRAKNPPDPEKKKLQQIKKLIVEQARLREKKRGAETMKHTRSFDSGLAELAKLWEPGRFQKALTLVNRLLQEWPDNPLLLVKKAHLIQLQVSTEGPDLEEAQAALERAAELDEASPLPLIELGFFHFAVQDDAQTALTYFEKAEELSKKLLKECRSGKKAALRELAENQRNGSPAGHEGDGHVGSFQKKKRKRRH